MYSTHNIIVNFMENKIMAYSLIALIIGLIIGALVIVSTGVGTSPKVSYLNHTVYVNNTKTVTQYVNKSSVMMSDPVMASFLGGNVISTTYTRNYSCVPNLSEFFVNQSNASKIATGCEVGTANKSDYPAGTAPLYVLVPAYGGLSIFGVAALGANAQGYPTFTYNKSDYVIPTDCGASGSLTGCMDHPLYAYSPVFTAVEDSLNITKGVFGLPEGVLPLPSHDHLLGFETTTSIPWNVVVVLVNDPNIMPNPQTGQCTQIVPSNQSNSTENCLNSITALERAMGTQDSAVSLANTNNPIWNTLGKPMEQVVVPGATSPSTLGSVANTNIVLYFNATSNYPPI